MNPTLILAFILLVANGTLVISLICKSKDEKKQISALKEKKREEALKKSIRDRREEVEVDFTEEDLKDEIEPKQLYSWIVGVVICLDIWLIGAVATHWWAEYFFEDVAETDSRKALFGDSFGAVNALVSALAFAGMIVAFILQRYELRLQRKELKDNRAEMAQQTNQFVAENNNLVIQRFENLFYNMLNLQQIIVDGLRYDYYEEEYVTVAFNGPIPQRDKRLIRREVVGREVFRFLFDEASFDVEDHGHTLTFKGYRRYLYRYGMKEYDRMFIPSYFDHYFRHLYKIVQFVDEQEVADILTKDDAYRYLSYVRGTLSRYELVWLYYNALHPDYNKFKKLIEKYSFLKALRSDLLTLTKEAEDYYMGLGIDRSTLVKGNLGINDFYFYMTDGSADSTKYQISAFWNQEDYHLGIERLAKWRSFIDDKAKSIKHDEETPISK